jgi:PleD family two-component response regulator
MKMQAPLQHILLIDDDCDDCIVFEQMLRTVAPSIKLTCLSGCKNVLSSIDNCKADLIFLDLNMPKENGFHCLKVIQESASHNRIPIIMYSSSDNPKAINIAYGLGAALYFKKPTRYFELEAALKNILALDWCKPDVVKQHYFKEGKYYSYAL